MKAAQQTRGPEEERKQNQEQKQNQKAERHVAPAAPTVLRHPSAAHPPAQCTPSRRTTERRVEATSHGVVIGGTVRVRHGGCHARIMQYGAAARAVRRMRWRWESEMYDSRDDCWFAVDVHTQGPAFQMKWWNARSPVNYDWLSLVFSTRVVPSRSCRPAAPVYISGPSRL